MQGQVSDVMDVMRDNIGKVLQRGEKLDDLEEKSGMYVHMYVHAHNQSCSFA